MLRWRNDPVTFVREVIGAEPQDWQKVFLRNVARDDRVAIRSCHGPGKSAALSWLVLWWLYTRCPAKIACTAPTGHQLSDVLWSEINTWWRQIRPEPLRALTVVKSETVELVSAPKESFAVARTARPENPDAFQGFHSKNMLFIIDEASGVDDVIFEVGAGSMSTHGAKTVMTGNPTRTSGYFYEAFHKAREHWTTMRVSHEDSELVTDDYVEQMASVYGRDSNVFRVRCLGEFPRSEDDVIIPLWLVDAALERDVEPTGYRPVWGVDVARYGDDRSALAKRSGNHMDEPVKWWHGADLMETVGKIVEEYRLSDEKPVEILVDSIGVGAGVVDRLSELGLPARGINVGEASRMGGFTRLRSELWWEMRNWFQGLDVWMCRDDALISEIVQVKYKTLSTGKLEAEPKDDMKKRMGRSPDLADAFMLTFAGQLIRPDEDAAIMDRYARAVRKRKRSWKTM